MVNLCQHRIILSKHQISLSLHRISLLLYQSVTSKGSLSITCYGLKHDMYITGMKEGHGEGAAGVHI